MQACFTALLPLMTADPMKDLKKRKVKELKVMCRDRGLPIGGKKADLIERLDGYVNEERDGEADSVQAGDGDSQVPSIPLKVDMNPSLVDRHSQPDDGGEDSNISTQEVFQEEEGQDDSGRVDQDKENSQPPPEYLTSKCVDDDAARPLKRRRLENDEVQLEL